MSTATLDPNHHGNPSLVDLAAAFEKVRPEIDTVPDDAFFKKVIDVPYATTTAMAAADRIDELLPELARLPEYDLHPVHGLRGYAGAALHAHLMARELVAQPRSMSVLFQEAGRLRGDLTVLAEALARLGLFSAAQISALRSGRRYADVANALCALATLYEQRWPEIGSQVPISRQTVALAARIGAELQLGLGRRRLPPLPRERPRGDGRRVAVQALSLFIQAYDHCRRGVTFVRWTHGDVGHYVPSLYPRRPRKSSGMVPSTDPLLDVDRAEAEPEDLAAA